MLSSASRRAGKKGETRAHALQGGAIDSLARTGPSHERVLLHRQNDDFARDGADGRYQPCDDAVSPTGDAHVVDDAQKTLERRGRCARREGPPLGWRRRPRCIQGTRWRTQAPAPRKGTTRRRKATRERRRAPSCVERIDGLAIRERHRHRRPERSKAQVFPIGESLERRLQSPQGGSHRADRGVEPVAHLRRRMRVARIGDGEIDRAGARVMTNGNCE